MKIRALSLLLLSVTGVAGCSASRPAAVSEPVIRPVTTPLEPTLRDRDWGVLRSPSQGLKLALPEARAWLVDSRPSSGATWDLRHEPTGTRLNVRRWRASRLPQVDNCVRELRQRAAGLVLGDETNLVSERTVRVPQGFSTRITLLALPAPAQRLHGQVVAVGAGVGECIAALVDTECQSETELAERLRLFDVALAHLRLIRVEDRVPEPLPPQH